MRGTALALATLSLLSASEAIDLVKRSSPAVVGLGIERKRVANPIEHDRARRGWKRQDNQGQQGDWVLQDLDNEVCMRWNICGWTGIFDRLTYIHTEIIIFLQHHARNSSAAYSHTHRHRQQRSLGEYSGFPVLSS